MFCMSGSFVVSDKSCLMLKCAEFCFVNEFCVDACWLEITCMCPITDVCFAIRIRLKRSTQAIIHHCTAKELCGFVKIIYLRSILLYNIF